MPRPARMDRRSPARPPRQAEELIEELLDGQLVDLARQDDTGHPRYRLHKLLHAFARERVQAGEPVAHQQAALKRIFSGWLELAADDHAGLRLELVDTLPRLRPDQRAVLILRDLEGCSKAEAAAKFGIEIGTVKSQLHQARRAFRDRWQP
jgi:RNA polymerase sigma factor (sigma-70 family)